VEHCIHGAPTVFLRDVKPWIDPAGADVATIVATIRKCPSGALTYILPGEEETKEFGGEAAVLCEVDGPYEVSGGVELRDTEFAATAPRDHYLLCRCGGSRNKPFCDGTHWHNGFADPDGPFAGGASARVERGEAEVADHGGPPDDE
jgi:CDGSH-type Zn-finger protein